MANIGKTPAPERPKYHSPRGFNERHSRARAKPESLLPTSPPTSRVPRAKNAKEVASASKTKATITSRPVASVTRSTVQEMRNTPRPPDLPPDSPGPKIRSKIHPSALEKYQASLENEGTRPLSKLQKERSRAPVKEKMSARPLFVVRYDEISINPRASELNAIEKSRAPGKEKGSTRPLLERKNSKAIRLSPTSDLGKLTINDRTKRSNIEKHTVRKSLRPLIENL